MSECSSRDAGCILCTFIIYKKQIKYICIYSSLHIVTSISVTLQIVNLAIAPIGLLVQLEIGYLVKIFSM